MTLWPRPSYPTQQAIAVEATSEFSRPSERCNTVLDGLDRRGLASVYTGFLAEDVRYPRVRLAACATGAISLLAAGETRRLLVDRYSKAITSPLHRSIDVLESYVTQGCTKIWPSGTAHSAPSPRPPSPGAIEQANAGMGTSSVSSGPKWVGRGAVFLPRAFVEMSALAYLGISEGVCLVVGSTSGVVFGLLIATPIATRLSDEHMHWLGEVQSVLRRTRAVLEQKKDGTESHQAALVVLAAAMLTQLAQHIASGTGQALLNHVATLLAPVAPLSPKKAVPPPARSGFKGARRFLSVIAEDDEHTAAAAQSVDEALKQWMQIVSEPEVSDAEVQDALAALREALAYQPVLSADASAAPTAGPSRLAARATARGIPARPRTEARPQLQRTVSLPLARSV